MQDEGNVFCVCGKYRPCSCAAEIVGVVNIQSVLDFFQQQFQKYCFLFPFQFADLLVLSILIISQKCTFPIKQHFLLHETQRDII